MLIPDLIRAVLLRWKLELAILLGVLLLSLIWLAQTPRYYSATATLLFDNQAPQPVSADSGQRNDAAPGIATEAKIIASETIAREVVNKLGIANQPDMRASWMQATAGRQSYPGWLASNLQSGLDVKAVDTSNIVEVSYSSRSPEKAAAMANAFASTYVDARLQMSTDPAKTYASWFERRIAEARQRLEQTQNALAAFQRQRGIVSTGSIDAESTRLGELSSQLSGAEAQAADARARATVGGASMPEVQSSGVIQGLRSQIASKSAEIQDLRAELGPNHPEMRAAVAQLAELRAKLASETGTTSGTLSAASNAAVARESSIRALLAAQRARMLALTGDRSTLEVLERDAASARQAYDSVTQQLSLMRLKSTLPATNVRVLGRAEPPLLPSSPNLQIRFLMTLLFGIMLAIGTAIALDWGHPKVRSEAALLRHTGAPVLGSASFQRMILPPAPQGGATS
jgi:polysaccharide biosynthesis transport protein